MNYDFSKMCRICLKEDVELNYIFSDVVTSIDDIPLPDKIMACSAIQMLLGDGLPDMICTKCLIQVGIAYEFRERCQSADATLRKYLLIMTPFLRSNSQDNGLKYCKDDDNELNSYLDLEPEFHIKDDVTNETSIYDFDKEIYSSDVETQLREDTDSDIPLIINEAKHKRKKKKLKEKCLQKQKVQENSDLVTDSDKKKKDKEDKDVECPVCKKTFAYMCILKDHMVQHTGARPYLCSACGKSFAHTASLTNHMKIHYTNKPHKCDRCDLSFHRKAHLILHMRTHTGEKPFVCDVCGRDFAQNSYLKEHMRVHSGEKPFKCDICGHGFARKSCLVMHRRVHTGELPYACPECGRAFSQRSQRKRHVKRNHKGSACLRETGELILKDLDLKNKKLHERNNVMFNDCSASPNRSNEWALSSAQSCQSFLSEPAKDLYQDSSTELAASALPLTLRIPKSLLQ